MSTLRLGDFVTYEMSREDRKAFARNDFESAWTTRSDDAHVGIVIQLLNDGDVRVWDTVENDWWVADEASLTRVVFP